jgi:hypothetical protein
MRPLTQQEIDQAPEWATHYVINPQYVIWQSKHLSWIALECFIPCYSSIGMDDHAQPIPRKEFDISDPFPFGASVYANGDGGTVLYADAIDVEAAVFKDEATAKLVAELINKDLK